MTPLSFRSGIVALIGRPNVGKSTLLNRLVGEKISIVSRRPQTTRHRILGIKTTNAGQVVYVDTPGLHAPRGRLLNHHLNRLARASVEGVDVVVAIIAAGGWRPEDNAALDLVRPVKIPIVLAINKIDRTDDRRTLLPLTRESIERFEFAEVVPVSARTSENVDALERAVIALLPEQAPIYPADWLTDKSDKFRARETIREQIFALYGQEIPHATAVEVTQFRRRKGRLDIEAVIWAEREGQKAILIGKGGKRLKQVGMRARQQLEQRHDGKVDVRLWVKVSKGWSDDARAMQRFGYRDELV